MTHALPINDHDAIRKAVWLSVFSNIAFSVEFALMQLAGKSLGAPLIIAVNSTILLAVIVVASLYRGHRLYFKTAYPKQQSLRCLLRVAANATGIWALLHIPLTTHIVIGFLSPLLVAMIGPYVLKEPRVRKAAVSAMLGLAGVFVILSVETAPLLPLLGAFLGVLIGSMNSMFVRAMPRDHPFTFMLYTNLFLAAAFWPFALGDIPKLTLETLLILGWAGLAAAFANYAYFRSNLLASPQHIAPLAYTQLLWGALLGWLVWQHVPTPAFWLGAVLIIVGSALLLPRAKTAG